VLGTLGGLFVFALGMLYLEYRRRQAQTRGEGYGEGHVNEPEPVADELLPNPWVALAPLIVVGVGNILFTRLIPVFYGPAHEFQLAGMAKPVATNVAQLTAIWAVQAALILGILTVLVFAWKPVSARFAEGTKAAVAGSLLASMNTASEYGFGGVIASLPGFVAIADLLRAIPNPLVNQAITVNVLAGITGSASGGMSIALAAMADQFKAAAEAAGIDFQVLHRGPRWPRAAWTPCRTTGR
jgi:H+/gluconate symporter-like permease